MNKIEICKVTVLDGFKYVTTENHPNDGDLCLYNESELMKFDGLHGEIHDPSICRKIIISDDIDIINSEIFFMYNIFDDTVEVEFEAEIVTCDECHLISGGIESPDCCGGFRSEGYKLKRIF